MMATQLLPSSAPEEEETDEPKVWTARFHAGTNSVQLPSKRDAPRLPTHREYSSRDICRPISCLLSPKMYTLTALLFLRTRSVANTEVIIGITPALAIEPDWSTKRRISGGS